VKLGISHLRVEHGFRVFEKRVLRTIFGTKSKEGAGEWRRLHNEGLHNMHTSLNMMRVIKSRRMRWVGNVAP